MLTEVDSVRYATTLGTNALIERRGPQVGAIVTAGFEATIPLSRGRGYGEGLDELAKNDMSSGTRPDPLVPQTLIRSVSERVDFRGTVLLELDHQDVRRALRELVDAGAEALVVCLTNAVENPVHELAVQEIFLSEYPAHQLGAIPMLLSHQLSGRKGEYVRATSAIVDGFLHATMYHALSELEQNLREHGYARPMLVIHNSGGMAQLNSTDALQTIHSGPVAGISASEHLAGQAGLGNVVATDMGGTSFDIGLVPADGVKQNSVREPKLQYQDLKVKLYSALRIKERVLALVDEVGRDAFIVSLRKSLEDIEAEARRRISALPDGTYRVNFFSDSTLRENVLLKYPCAITVKGDELTVDWRGAAPQIMNRAFNSTLGSSKCGMNQAFLGFFWPDLPRGISVMNPIEVLSDEGSCVNPGNDAPLGQSLQSVFKTFGVTQALFAKMQYSCPEKYGSVIAPWFNQINTFLFGGVTQHGEFVGNVCADLNGMGGGARAHRDGENSMAPFFAAMADIGEQEIIEDDVPFLQLISKKIKRDAQGFGKQRGGMGYEIAVAARGTPLWGFATVSSGSKFPAVPGLFGGYGCPDLSAVQDQGGQRLQANARCAADVVVRLRDADEHPAVRRGPVLHPSHGHGLRARRRGRGVHDQPGQRRRVRRRARA